MRLAQHREQVRQSSQEELERLLQEERRNLFMCRRDAATKQLENPKRVREIRKRIARILTEIRRRELEALEGRG